MSYYPKIDPDTVKSIIVARKLAAEQPDYFSNDECPYPNAVIDFLGVTPTPSKIMTASGDEIDLEKEIAETYVAMGKEKPNPSDAAALQGFYRTRTTLMGKLSELRERTLNQKSMGEFYSKVLEILDEIATPTQRTIFSEKLAEFAKHD